jgi:hypothetical protein
MIKFNLQPYDEVCVIIFTIFFVGKIQVQWMTMQQKYIYRRVSLSITINDTLHSDLNIYLAIKTFIMSREGPRKY